MLLQFTTLLGKKLTDSVLVTDFPSIQAAFDAASNIHFPAGNYGILDSIKVRNPGTITCDPGTSILPISGYSDTSEFEFTDKVRNAIFYCDVDDVRFEMPGILNGQQNMLISQSKFMNGVIFHNCNNYSVDGLNVRLAHNSFLAIYSDNGDLRNVSYNGSGIGHSQYKNCAVDLQLCNNVEVHDIISENAEESIDINGGCTHVNFSNISGDNISQAIVEINSSEHVYGTGVSGTNISGAKLKIQKYGREIYNGMVNRNITVENIQGASDFIDETGDEIPDISIY